MLLAYSKGKLWKHSHIVLNSLITQSTPTRNVPEAPELGTLHYTVQSIDSRVSGFHLHHHRVLLTTLHIPQITSFQTSVFCTPTNLLIPSIYSGRWSHSGCSVLGLCLSSSWWIWQNHVWKEYFVMNFFSHFFPVKYITFTSDNILNIWHIMMCHAVMLHETQWFLVEWRWVKWSQVLHVYLCRGMVYRMKYIIKKSEKE